MREQAKAAKEARRQQQAVKDGRAREAAAAIERQRVEALKVEKRKLVARLLPSGTSVRQGLRNLSITVAEGPGGETSALKRARAFYHPDSAMRRSASLEDRVLAEEIFKALGGLRP